VTVVVSWLAPTSRVSVYAVADHASAPALQGAVALIAMVSDLPGASFASRTLMTPPERVAVA
jgi:hypothetical protein